MSGILTSLENLFTTKAPVLEQDVINIIADIKNDIAVAEADVTSALNWIAGETPAIASTLQTVLGLVEAVGVGANPEVAAAITAANVAVTALNAFAASQNSAIAAAGTGTVTVSASAKAVIAGYQAYTQANAAAAAAKAAAATAVA